MLPVPAPIRIGSDPAPAKSHTPSPPIKISGGGQEKKAPPSDPGQPEIDLVAVSVTDNGLEAVGTIRCTYINGSGVPAGASVRVQARYEGPLGSQADSHSGQSSASALKAGKPAHQDIQVSFTQAK